MTKIPGIGSHQKHDRDGIKAMSVFRACVNTWVSTVYLGQILGPEKGPLASERITPLLLVNHTSQKPNEDDPYPSHNTFQSNAKVSSFDILL